MLSVAGGDEAGVGGAGGDADGVVDGVWVGGVGGEAGAAHTYMEDNKAKGKVVMIIP